MDVSNFSAIIFYNVWYFRVHSFEFEGRLDENRRKMNGLLRRTIYLNEVVLRVSRHTKMNCVLNETALRHFSSIMVVTTLD